MNRRPAVVRPPAVVLCALAFGLGCGDGGTTLVADTADTDASDMDVAEPDAPTADTVDPDSTVGEIADGARDELPDLPADDAGDVEDAGEEDAVDPPDGTGIPCTTESLYAVWPVARNDAWVAGANGTVLRLGLSYCFAEVVPATVSLFGIWASAPDDVWVVGLAGTILHRGTDGWSSFPPPLTRDMFGIWGTSRDDVWAVGQGESSAIVLRWDGTAWTVARAVPGAGYRAVWASAPDDVWVVGARVLVRWDGTVWTEIPALYEDIYGPDWGPVLWAAGPDDVWIAGETGHIKQWHDGSWTTMRTEPFAAMAACGLWGSSADDVWAVGRMGPLLGVPPDTSHWIGGEWVMDWDPPGGARPLNAVRGTDASDVWAVGDGGAVRHYDGTAWTLVR